MASEITFAPISSTKSLPDFDRPILEFSSAPESTHKERRRATRLSRTFSFLFYSQKENAGIVDSSPDRANIVKGTRSNEGKDGDTGHSSTSTWCALSQTSTLIRRSRTFSLITKTEASSTSTSTTTSPVISSPILPPTPPTMSTEAVHFTRLSRVLREQQEVQNESAPEARRVRRFKSFSGFRSSKSREPEWSFDVRDSKCEEVNVVDYDHRAQVRSVRCRSTIMDGSEGEIELMY
ncbi:hypothetical protein PM082_007209 [Marasmius tenuissimus]|nr:hypothetical protein PM082_007209 [Marasmius tenuissimus]